MSTPQTGLTASPRPSPRVTAPTIGTKAEESPWRKRLIRGGAQLLALGIAIGIWFALRPNPHLERVKEIRALLGSEEAKNMSPEGRGALFREMRTESEGLSRKQRDEAFPEMAERRKAMKERMANFMKKSKEEQEAELDSFIDNPRQFFGGGGPGGGGPWGGGGGGPGGPGGGNRQGGGNPPGGGNPQGGGPGGNGQGGGGGRPPWGGGGGGDRTTRQKNMIDNTTPEERMEFRMFFAMVGHRMEQRGMGGGMWGGGGGGGGRPPR